MIFLVQIIPKKHETHKFLHTSAACFAILRSPRQNIFVVVEGKFCFLIVIATIRNISDTHASKSNEIKEKYIFSTANTSTSWHIIYETYKLQQV